jgi:hypothetical protein
MVSIAIKTNNLSTQRMRKLDLKNERSTLLYMEIDRSTFSAIKLSRKDFFSFLKKQFSFSGGPKWNCTNIDLACSLKRCGHLFWKTFLLIDLKKKCGIKDIAN